MFLRHRHLAQKGLEAQRAWFLYSDLPANWILFVLNTVKTSLISLHSPCFGSSAALISLSRAHGRVVFGY